MRKLYLNSLILLAFGAFQLGKPTPPPPSPEIVARDYLALQTTGIPLTTIYTPTSDGIFRVTGYIVFTDTAFVGTNETATCNIQWVDELQTETIVNFVSTSPSGLGTFYGDATIHVKANQPIQFLVGLGGSPTPSPYNLYLTVIKE